MAWFRTSVTRCARIRARVAACARREDGELLIEVLFSAMLVALIAGAILNAFAGIAHLAGDQRHRVEANALAEQDQARLRSLTITQLAGSQGNTNYQTVVDGTTYTITSTSSYISGNNAGAACASGTTTSTADEVETSSKVTWGTNNDNRNPVIIHGLVTPNEGGSLVVAAATGATGASGLAGVTVTLSGPTTVSPLTTDGTGCAIFGGLAGGSYTASFTPPTGDVTFSGATTVPNQTQTIVPTSTASMSVPALAAPGGITASFTTAYNGQTNIADNSDQFVATNQQMNPTYRIYGTDSSSSANTYQTAISTGNVLYPFGTSSTYTVYAGGCTGDVPPAGNQVAAAVSSGSSTPVTIPEPAMIITPYSGTSAFTYFNTNAALVKGGAGWTSVTNANDASGKELSSATTGNTITFQFYGTQVTWTGTKSKASGEANVTLDGTQVATNVDLYNASTVYKQTLYTSATLTPGLHTLVISVTGNKSHSGAGTGTAISVDTLTGTQLNVMTTKPNVIVTDNNTGCGANKDYPPTVSNPSTSASGALSDPGEPYGTNWTVCVDNGTNHDTVTGVSNTSYTTGNPVTAIIASGATGYGTGVCT